MMKYFLCLFFINNYLMFIKLLMFTILLMFLLIMDFNWVNLSNFMFIDYLSFFMMLIIIIIFMLVSLIMEKKSIIFMKYFLFMLLLTFLMVNLLYMYMMLEISLLLMVLMLICYGNQFERISASMYMLFYTLVSSLLLYVSMMLYINYYKDLLFYWNNFINMNYLFLGFMLMFLIKMPMFMFHLWLPKAHVEASVSGSMILSSIMLKLGSYGLYRLFQMFYYKMVFLSMYLLVYNLIGAIVISGLIINEVDVKKLIAYSSIIHMNFLLSNFFSMTKIGLLGVIIVMVSHSMISSGMFYLVGLIYNRLMIRSMLMMKGLLNLFPFVFLYWGMMVLSNMSCPPSLNFLGEMMMVISLMMKLINLILLLMIYLFVNIILSLYFLMLIQYGKMNLFINLDIYVKEYLCLMFYSLSMNYLFIYLLF
uniref:NADH dehydrogenase subunit 4 n=1 Tax=Dipterophagus daci TaxID=2800156 RepID=UPI001D107902|nr:NADH dehydrogenase subunit 4 [Dipterophagus daci]QZO77420.1 NADH dehydrogenase subunit 4 [Dipterophagus daci]